MCLGCVVDGSLSLETYNKLEAFNTQWDDAQFGPAHIALSDCNVFDKNIQFCLANIESYNDYEYSSHHSPAELIATKTFLLELLTIPEDAR